MGDCCADVETFCPATCEGSCGAEADLGCFCDVDCAEFGDCCPDVETACEVGCTDGSACNYNEEAITDDGSCQTLDECGVCGGDGIADGACDCDGNVDLGCGCGEAGPSGCDNACGSTPVS